MVGSRTNSRGRQIYQIELGREELELIAAMAENVYVVFPRVFETIPTLGRLRGIRKTIREILERNEIETR